MFPVYRKFFVLFGVLILFIMFFVNYWKMYAIETFTASTQNYPEKYYSGQQVNIDGKYGIGDPNNRYKENGGPLQTTGSIACETKCQQQEECNRRNGNTCTTRSTPDKKCYCTFRQTTESFQDIAQTVDNFNRIMTHMPNFTKPSWVYSKTNGSFVQVGKDTILLTDLKIDDLNKMTFSFRIKSDTPDSANIPIFSFGSSNGGTFDFITKKYNTLEINTPSKVVSIGLGTTEKRITITIENGVYRVYKDGEANRNDISSAAGIIPTPSFLNANKISLILNKTNANGVYMKDLKTFNQSLSEDDVRLSE